MQDPKSIVGATHCGGCAEVPVDRLTFLKRSAAAVAAIALAGCGADSPTAPGNLSATTISLASNPALASVSGVATLSIDGSPVAVVRESATTFAAFSLVCPHQGSTVQPNSGSFYCPGHGARFSLSGQWTGGQSTSNLRSYPVAYDASAGTVTIGG